MLTKPCIICGKPIYAKFKSQLANRKTCSRECRGKIDKRRSKPEQFSSRQECILLLIEVIQAICNVDFYTASLYIAYYLIVK